MRSAAMREVIADKHREGATMRRAAEPDRGKGNRKDWRDRTLNVLIAVLLVQAAVIFLMIAAGLAYMALY